jgi:hypothetical protein
MARVSFTRNLERHVAAPRVDVPGRTVSEALGQVFAQNPRLASYVVDEHGRLRKHVAVFVDGELVRDRERLSDEIGAASEIVVMQALSGG